MGVAGRLLRHEQDLFWGDSVSRNPTDRGKVDSKRSVLIHGRGGPQSVVVAGANVYDTKLLEITLESVVVERHGVGDEGIQHLCLDRGYDNSTGHQAVAVYRYRGHVKRIRKEKPNSKGIKRYSPCRWVVERTLAWLSKCRAILVQCDKKATQLLGPNPIRARLDLVPPPTATSSFEIVSIFRNMASRWRPANCSETSGLCGNLPQLTVAMPWQRRSCMRYL